VGDRPAENGDSKEDGDPASASTYYGHREARQCASRVRGVSDRRWVLAIRELIEHNPSVGPLGSPGGRIPIANGALSQRELRELNDLHRAGLEVLEAHFVVAM
jgi:hypothetical protein